MNLISLTGVSKALGEGPLFSGVSFGIDEGDRVGFVGKNGCGKSTVLKLLSGRMESDEGEIARKRGLIVNVQDQNPIWESGDTIRSFLYRSDDPLVALVGRYEAALAAPGVGAAADLTHEMETRGGFDLERRFLSFLTELGIDDLNAPVAALSGGMLRKVALARCLAPPSDLVLLDEPTNHLDLDTIEWLENRLLSTGQAFVLVTHDRWFLDAVCNSIMEIDGGEVRKYPGNYSDYLEKREERAAAVDSRERRREAILRVELEWLKRGPKARGGKDKKRKDRIAEMIDGRPATATADSDAFRTAKRRLGGKVLQLEAVGKSWSERWVLKEFSYVLKKGERIGVVGPNGSGKSTLLDLIAGRIRPDAGVLKIGETVSVGYFDQHADGIDLSLTVIGFVRQAAERVVMADGGELSAEQFLERFAFPRAMNDQTLSRLSGGELRRLLLVRLLARSPNVLLMDEPTNDFDIPTIALLEDFLSSFSGCLIVVSHDRSFLEGMTDSLWVLDGSGLVEPFVGSYREWRERRAEDDRRVEAAKRGADRRAADYKAGDRPTVNPVVASRSPDGKLSFKERQEYDGILGEIAALEDEKAALEAAFAAPDGSLARDGDAFAAARKRYADLGISIDNRIARWETLAARAEP